MKKGMALLALALVLVMVLEGCGAGSRSGQDSEGAKTLRVVMGLSETEWDVMKKDIFPKFEQEHGIKIEAVQAEAGDVPDLLAAQVGAGKVNIDLITQDVNALYGLFSRDLVEDLSAYRSELPKEVIPAMIDVSTFDGRLFFLPYRPNVEITYYNEKAFEDHGLKPPTNWEELLAAAKAFYEQDGVGRVAIKANQSVDQVLHLFDFIRSAGGDPYVLNDEGSKRAFQFLKELAPYLAPDSKTADWNTMNQYLATDAVYLGQNWPFGVNVIVEKGGKKEIKAYHGWSGPVKESHVLGGEVIGIPKGAPHKDEALQFARYLMSKDVQEILVSKLAWPAVRSDAYGHVTDWQKPYFEAIKEALEKAEPRGNVDYWPTVEKALLDAYRDIVVQGKDVDATLDHYASVIQSAQGGK